MTDLTLAPEHTPWYLDPDGPYCYTCMADHIDGAKVPYPCPEVIAWTG